jgi:hypothetical protein
MGEGSCLLADRLEEALAAASRALTLARDRGERGHEAWALRLLGEIASHPGRPDVATAEAHYGAATALATELGMRPLVAHHLGLGTLYRRIGKPEPGQEHLTTATTMYRRDGDDVLAGEGGGEKAPVSIENHPKPGTAGLSTGAAEIRGQVT